MERKPENLTDDDLDGAAGGYELKNVLITSYQTGGAGNDEAGRTRKLSLTSMTEGESNGV